MLWIYSIKKTWNFRWYMDEADGNDEVITRFVQEIENEFMIKEPYKDSYRIKNQLVRSIMSELDGKYYDMMYPKRKHTKGSFYGI